MGIITMSFNRSDFGLEAVITITNGRVNQNSAFSNAKREKKFKSFIIYYPLCHESITQYQDASCNESMTLNGVLVSLDPYL
jgi:hypothetical protein